MNTCIILVFKNDLKKKMTLIINFLKYSLTSLLL